MKGKVEKFEKTNPPAFVTVSGQKINFVSDYRDRDQKLADGADDRTEKRSSDKDLENRPFQNFTTDLILLKSFFEEVGGDLPLSWLLLR